MLKKLMSFIIILALMVGVYPTTLSFAKSQKDTEYNRAISYGIVPKSLKKEKKSRTIKWKEYCTLMYNTLSKIDKSAAKKFKKDAERGLKSKKEMQIYQGTFVLYRASEFVGENHAQKYHGGSGFLNPYEIDYGNTGNCNDFKEYTGENDEWTYQEIHTDFDNSIYRMVAQIYGYRRASYISFKPCFTSDKKPAEKFTVEDAIHSAVRFYESREEFAKEYWLNRLTELEKQTVEDSEELNIETIRKNILESETTIKKSETFILGETYTGAAYYVSNTGDDSNSGTSPDQAWKTLHRVEEALLLPGDAVFFERGGVYRGTLNKTWPESVTYSAYGTGEKPILTTSSENSARKECWELYSDKDGILIWKYYKDVMDCGGVIFNNEKAGNKVLAEWSIEKKTWINDKGKKFNVKNDLTEDLDFFSDDSSKYINADLHVNKNIKGSAAYGSLYLRCDNGNPGDVFSDIELCVLTECEDERNYFNSEIMDAWEKCVIDNISFRYFPHAALTYRNGQIIQNCEFSWGGGCVQFIQNGKVTGRMGDALCGCGCNNLTVRNNYFHDLYAGAIIMEGGTEDFENIDFSKNLTVRCRPYNVQMENINITNLHITDNTFIGAGTGWGIRSMKRNETDEEVYAIRLQDTSFKNSSIERNDFYYPLQFALYIEYNEKGMPDFIKNRYYLAGDSSFIASWNTNDATKEYVTVLPGQEKSFLKNEMQDKTSKVIRR
jgi:hypothetical protein